MQPLASHLAFLSLTCLPYKMEVLSLTHPWDKSMVKDTGPDTKLSPSPGITP